MWSCQSGDPVEMSGPSLQVPWWWWWRGLVLWVSSGGVVVSQAPDYIQAGLSGASPSTGKDVIP